MGCRQLLALLVLSTTGCATIADYHYVCVNKYRAKTAWWSAKSSLPKECRNADFAKGYEAGYLDASRGGDGTAPPVPPSCYWGPAYQTNEGRCQVDSWYAGFHRGAQDAMNCGRDQWHNVPSTCNQACTESCGQVDSINEFESNSSLTVGPTSQVLQQYAPTTVTE